MSKYATINLQIDTGYQKQNKDVTMAKKKVGLLMIILAIFLPFVAVFLRKGVGKDLIINIILCIFFYLPGTIHALWVIMN